MATRVILSTDSCDHCVLFLDVFEHIDVLGDTRCITVVGEHLGGEVDKVERVESTATQLEMIRERLGGDVGVDDIGVLEIKDSCVFNSIDDEGKTSAFGGFLQLENMPQKLVDGIGEGANSGSGIVGDNWV